MATERKKGLGRRSRGGPVRRDPDATRAALRKSAVTLFEKYGYEGTSVQQIVDKAGRTKGAFYHYFESKEDLLRDVHDEFIDYQLERAHAVLKRDAPADELLAQLVTEVLMEPLGIYKSEISVYLQEQRFLSDAAFDEIRVKRDEFENCVVQIIQRGVDTGIFKELGPARLVAFGVIGMCAWSHTWLDSGGELSVREIGDMFGKIVVDGLRV
ncbi:TetR/AcrR family transcriptional regulator [Phytoactinopolyspora limicola]|uniref:TetR/AcrR family transcriptional regulator n=1 Tax=Phytoactinopolyspora limicola TaxID=2715536 RepID=UPI0014082AF5|nr:TetR/AcrR family transcriptional regulator [Phytoactinopolyspora limicola]